MRQEYETNKRKRSTSPTSSTDSKASLEIYYKALHTYPPQIDESNAESVERTTLMERHIRLLKQQRVHNKEMKKKTDKLNNLQLPDSSTSKEEKKEAYTNNSNTYDFQEEEPQSTQSIQTHQIEAIMDTELPSPCYLAISSSFGRTLNHAFIQSKDASRGGVQTIKLRWENSTLSSPSTQTKSEGSSSHKLYHSHSTWPTLTF
jgi:hypothetical protein